MKNLSSKIGKASNSWMSESSGNGKTGKPEPGYDRQQVAGKLQDVRSSHEGKDRELMEWSVLNDTSKEMVDKAVADGRISRERAENPHVRNHVANRVAQEMKKDGLVSPGTTKGLTENIYQVKKEGPVTSLELKDPTSVMAANRVVEPDPPQANGVKVYNAKAGDVEFTERATSMMDSTGLGELKKHLKEVHYETQAGGTTIVKLDSETKSMVVGERGGYMTNAEDTSGAIVLKRKPQMPGDAPFADRYHKLAHETAHHRDRESGWAKSNHPAFADQSKAGHVSKYAKSSPQEDYAETAAFVARSQTFGPIKVSGEWNDTVASKVQMVIKDLKLPPELFQQIEAANKGG